MWSYPLCFFSVAEISFFRLFVVFFRLFTLFLLVSTLFSVCTLSAIKLQYVCTKRFFLLHFIYYKNVHELSLFAIHMNNWSKLVTLVKILPLPQKKFSGLYSTMNRLLCLLKFARSLSVLDLIANLNDLFVARKTCKIYLIRLRPVFCQHFGNLPHAM